MKKLSLCILALVYFSLSYGQIGINTENPKALIHIDGASTSATTNPSSGAVTDAQALDDVVITKDGNIGIGTLSPSAKVSIVTTNSKKGISIIDGTEGVNKVLVSDDNGVGKWSFMPGSWIATLENTPELILGAYQYGYFDYKNYTRGLLSNPSQGAIDLVNGTITVPFEGYYKITLFGWFMNTTTVGDDGYYQISPGISINGIRSDWTPFCYSTQNYGNSASFSTLMKLKANDIISGYLDRSIHQKAGRTSGFSIIIEYYK